MAGIHNVHSAVQDHLVALIAGLGRTCTLGVPTPDELLADHIFMPVEVDDDDQQYAVSSLAAKDARFYLTLGVYARVLGTSAKAARDRVDESLLPIEAAIAAEFAVGGGRLGNLLMLAEVTSVDRDEANAEPDYRVHVATARIRCHAWLA